MVLNTSEGRKPFDRLILPVGWVRFQVDRPEGGGLALDWTLDVTAAGATTVLLARGASMDWESTFWSGSPVLIEDDYTPTGGRHIGGTIELRRDYPDLMGNSLAHERVHVAQSDFASIIWSIPLETAVLDAIGLPDPIARRVHFGAHHLLRWAVVSVVPYERDPWEMEARLLSGTDLPLPAVTYDQ
jgi:hypothetical protein